MATPSIGFAGLSRKSGFRRRSFSTRRPFPVPKEGGVFRAEKDYHALTVAALPLLKPGGILFASTNAAGFAPSEFLASRDGGTDARAPTALRAAPRRIFQSSAPSRLISRRFGCALSNWRIAKMRQMGSLVLCLRRPDIVLRQPLPTAWLRRESCPPDARVELLDGEMIDMSPIGPFHGGVTKYLNQLFMAAAKGGG